jgi:hypothetical protein
MLRQHLAREWFDFTEGHGLKPSPLKAKREAADA